MSYKTIIKTVILVLFLGQVTLSAQCPIEDCGPSGSGAAEAAIELPSPTITLIEMDFEGITPGNIMVSDLTDAYPGTTLSDVNALFSTTAANGFYNFQAGGGNALGFELESIVTSTEADGDLSIIAESDEFKSVDQLTISLSESTTEVGFQIGDWNEDFNILLFDGAANVGMLQVNTGCGGTPTCVPPIHFIQSDTPFDSFVLTEGGTAANWVLASLHLPESTMDDVEIVPTMGEWGIICLSIILMIFGVIAVRQRQTKIA